MSTSEGTAKERTPCANCGETVVYYPSNRSGDRVFCSNACSTDFYSGENHPDWKEKKTVECRYCGNEIEVSDWEYERRVYCDETCEGRWRSENLVGEDAPNWNPDYDSPTPLGENWREVRSRAMERDNGECRKCGRNDDEAIISVHHIVPRSEFDSVEEIEKEANRLDNLVTLCMRCHRKVESGKMRCPTNE